LYFGIAGILPASFFYFDKDYATRMVAFHQVPAKPVKSVLRDFNVCEYQDSLKTVLQILEFKLLTPFHSDTRFLWYSDVFLQYI